MPEEKVREKSTEKETESIFDENFLLERIGGNRDFYEEILRSFIEDTERLLSELKGYLESGEREKAERHAHSIKGAAANIGATPLSRASLRVEKAARERRMGAAEKLFSDMNREFDRLREVLSLV